MFPKTLLFGQRSIIIIEFLGLVSSGWTNWTIIFWVVKVLLGTDWTVIGRVATVVRRVATVVGRVGEVGGGGGRFGGEVGEVRLVFGVRLGVGLE